MTKAAALIPAIILCASPALALDKDFEIALTKGVYAADQGDYGRAADWLARALEISPGDPDALVSLAVVRRRAGDLRGAEELLRQALRARPGDAQASAALAAILEADGRGGEAERIRAAITEEDRAGPAAPPPYTLALLLGMQYDSNTVLDPSGPGASQDGKADWRMVAALDGSWALRRSPGLDLTLDYRFYQGSNSDHSDYDLTANTLTLKGRGRLPENNLFELSAGYDHALASGRRYSAVGFAQAGIGHEFPGGTLSFSVRRERRRFTDSAVFPANSERSGERSVLEARLRSAPGPVTVEISHAFYHDNADRDYWDRDGRTVRAGISGRNGRTRWFAAAAYTHGVYGGQDPAAATVRRDHVQRYDAGIMLPLTGVLSLVVSDSLVFYGSNVARFDYRRNVSGLFLLGRF